MIVPSFFFFFLLVLFQASFLAHFNFFGFFPNYVLIVLVLFNLFQDPVKKSGVFVSLWAGFLLDIFSLSSGGFFGLYLVLCPAASILMKFVLKKYVEIPYIKKI